MKPNQKSEAISQNLPPEILGDIFTIICGDDIYLPPQADRYPWILGHICSYWRQVLWNTHSIWKTIKTKNIISVWRIASMEVTRKAIAEMLIFILEKIDCPISLTIHASTDFYLDIIIEQSERFSTLYLADISETDALRLLNLPPSAFSALEHFTLAAPSFIGCLIFEHIASLFHTAPKLRSIRYLSNRVTIDPRVDSRIPFTLPFPKSKLEEISIENFALSFAEICDIWKNSPNLQSCKFSIKHGGRVAIQHIILSNLHLLHLTTHFTLDWDDILRPIMAPSLEDLYIHAPKFDIPALVSFISRSRCFLKILDVREREDNSLREEISGSAARNLLHHIPAATKLTIFRTLPTSAVESISDGALPHLEKASLHVSPKGLSSLLDMIDVYIDKSRTLPSFKITCNFGPGFDEVRTRYRTRRRLYRVEGVYIVVFDGKFFVEDDDDFDTNLDFDDDGDHYDDDEE